MKACPAKPDSHTNTPEFPLAGQPGVVLCAAGARAIPAPRRGVCEVTP